MLLAVGTVMNGAADFASIDIETVLAFLGEAENNDILERNYRNFQE
jgi:hypothetical protein